MHFAKLSRGIIGPIEQTARAATGDDGGGDGAMTRKTTQNPTTPAAYAQFYDHSPFACPAAARGVGFGCAIPARARARAQNLKIIDVC